MSKETFGSLLKKHAASAVGFETAVEYHDDKLSWKELDARSTRCAHVLRAKGVQPNDLVVIALQNGVLHHVWSFATWKLGATPCIVPSKLPGQELAQIIEMARPRVVVRQSSDSLAGIVQIDPASDGAPIPGEAALPDIAPNNWKAIASGGSTGRPKLIIDRAEGSYNASISSLIDLVRLPRQGVILNAGPLYHNAAFLFTSLALFARTKVVGLARFDAEECLRLIEAHEAEWVCLVPTMMHRIWSLPQQIRERYDLSSLRVVWHMAAPCPMWLKRAWIDWLGADRIFELYAGTEGAATVISGEEWLRKPGSVGRIQPDTLSIRRESGELCKAGEVGEIFFPAEAKTKFEYLGGTLKCDQQGRFSLGDLGSQDEDNYLFLADRRTDLILRGGANIYPAEVEGALDEHPTVANAVVIGLPCDEYGQRVHAILEPVPGAECNIEEINSFVRTRLSSYKCPETYEIVRGPLRDDAGKVRRSALKEERASKMQSAANGRTFIGQATSPAYSPEPES